MNATLVHPFSVRRVRPRSRLFLAAFVAALVACESGDSEGLPDLGVDPCAACSSTETCVGGQCVAPPDAGVAPSDLGPPDTGVPPDTGATPDLGPADSGVVDPCAPAGSRCVESRNCGPGRPSPTNCDFCPPDNRALCIMGRCQSPALLEPMDTQEVAFNVEGAFSTDLRALVGVVVAQETSGGAQLTCDDVQSLDFDLRNACYNVLTSRLISISQGGQTFTFTFGTFPGEVPVLLLVYGFGDRRASDAPLGVSCTPRTPEGPGSGPVSSVGGPMRAFP